MAEKKSREEIAQALEDRKEAINRRLDALQEEVLTTGAAIKEAVRENPLVGLGGAVAAGLLVGLIFGGRKKKRRLPALDAAHRDLVDRYIAAMVREVHAAVARGADPDDAVRSALDERTPLIVYAPASGPSKRGFFREFLDLSFKTALGFSVKTAIDLFTSTFDVEARLQELLEREEERLHDEAERDVPAPEVGSTPAAEATAVPDEQ